MAVHAVVLAWMRDIYDLSKEAGWGCALSNLRCSSGIVDSGRADVKHEDFRDHRLDRAMSELLQVSWTLASNPETFGLGLATKNADDAEIKIPASLRSLRSLR